MFLHLSVSHSVHRGGGVPLRQTPPRQTHPLGNTPLGRYPPPPDGHCRGRYTSYWNAFLCKHVISSKLVFTVCCGVRRSLKEILYHPNRKINFQHRKTFQSVSAALNFGLAGHGPMSRENPSVPSANCSWQRGRLSSEYATGHILRWHLLLSSLHLMEQCTDLGEKHPVMDRHYRFVWKAERRYRSHVMCRQTVSQINFGLI